MQPKIEIRGLEAALEILKFQPELVEGELAAAAEASLLGLRGPATEYPPEPYGSDYVRTLTLGRTWAETLPDWKAERGNFEASLGNATPYGPYVMGEEEQAWMHVNRWRTVDELLEDAEPQIRANFAAALKRVADKLEQKAQ